MLSGSYSRSHPTVKPFLHCWSLSVEEQFYLAFPPLMLLCKGEFSRHSLLTILSLTALASFICCQALMTSLPAWAFYLLPSRAWELLAGAILAVAADANRRPHAQ